MKILGFSKYGFNFLIWHGFKVSTFFVAYHHWGTKVYYPGINVFPFLLPEIIRSYKANR